MRGCCLGCVALCRSLRWWLFFGVGELGACLCGVLECKTMNSVKGARVCWLLVPASPQTVPVLPSCSLGTAQHRISGIAFAEPQIVLCRA